MEEAVAATGGRGFDVILEMLANVNLARDLKALAMGGRVAVIGSRGTVEIDPRDAMARDASVVGMSLFNLPDADRAVVHAALVAELESGTLRPVIGRELPLSAAAESHVAVMSPGAMGKIVLMP
jgi:NADPH2:quinone reductase